MSEAKEQNTILEALDFFYEKGSDFRIIRADGATLSITPMGTLQLLFYTDSVPVPNFERRKVQSSGKLGERTEFEVPHSGVIRTYESGVQLTPELAKEIGVLFQKHLTILNEVALNKNAARVTAKTRPPRRK